MIKKAVGFKWLNLVNNTPFVVCKSAKRTTREETIQTLSFCLDNELFLNLPFVKVARVVHPTKQETESKDFNVERFMKNAYKECEFIYYPLEKATYICELKLVRNRKTGQFTSKRFKILHILESAEEGQLITRDVSLYLQPELKQTLIDNYMKLVL